MPSDSVGPAPSKGWCVTTIRAVSDGWSAKARATRASCSRLIRPPLIVRERAVLMPAMATSRSAWNGSNSGVIVPEARRECRDEASGEALLFRHLVHGAGSGLHGAVELVLGRGQRWRHFERVADGAGEHTALVAHVTHHGRNGAFCGR